MFTRFEPAQIPSGKRTFQPRSLRSTRSRMVVLPRLWVIEMTIVTRLFVLDFAGAYLDARPEFSEACRLDGVH
jgi:hypothetical protein